MNCDPQSKCINKLKSNVVGTAALGDPQLENKNNIMSNTAITLIALIITIIVLLILAAVSLNMILGENGIINKAKIAKEKTNEATQKEEISLEDIKNKLNGTTSREINENEYNQIKEKVNSIGTIYEGTVVTNILKTSGTTKVNEIVIPKKGKYIINSIIAINWKPQVSIGLYVGKDIENIITSSVHVNGNSEYSSGYLNATAIKELNEGEKIEMLLYHGTTNFTEGKNLDKNNLQLIYMGE